MAFETDPLILSRADRRSKLAGITRAALALGLDYGGHGVALTETDPADQALEILQTWGMLDSGLLVPLALLPELEGADASTDGAAGVAPQPAAGDQLRALVGGAAYSATLEVSDLESSDVPGATALEINASGDADNHLAIEARPSGSHDSRLAAASTTDADVDVRVDPKGDGVFSWRGNILVRRNRMRRRAFASPDDGSLVLEGGLSAATEFGTSQQLQTSNRGAQREYTLGTSVGDVAGVLLPLNAQRRWNFSAVICWEASLLLDVRTWVGLFASTPANSQDPNTVQGIGIRFNGTNPGGEVSNYFRAWSCDGSGASTEKTLDGTSGQGLLQPAVNTQFRILIRNRRASLGTFQIWAQLGAEDLGANDGDWHFLAEFDSATESVPTASTALSAFAGFDRTQNTGARNFRVRLIDLEQN